MFSPSFLYRSLVFSAAALTLSTAYAAPKPLLQEGKQTLYQRVLTTPTCTLYEQVDSSAGKPVAAFERYYVYDKQGSGDSERIQVGPDSAGNLSGWLDKNCTVDWKMQLTLSFTNPAIRDPLLFFKDRDDIETILDDEDTASHVNPIRHRLDRDGYDPAVVAKEPDVFVDFNSQFYVLPVLEGEEVMAESGHRSRVLNIASVSKESNDSNASSKATDLSEQLKGFSAAVVFVIDSTISMDPYIERTKDAVRKVYEKIEAENLGDKVKFGMVSFRSSTEAVPGVEFVSKMFADPVEVENGSDFLERVKTLEQAKVSTIAYDEDSYAGVMQAINDVDWRQFGARYIVLITDAGALEGASEHSSTKLDAPQVREEAAKEGIAIYTLHLKDPSGAHNHAKAEKQYRQLSQYGATNSVLYYPVDAADLTVYGEKVDQLATSLTEQVQATYSGQFSAIGSAAHSTADYDDEPVAQTTSSPVADTAMGEDTELVGQAMRLAYLGRVSGAKAPPVFTAWISDRDLVKPTLPTVEVRVLLTRAELSDLTEVADQILQEASKGMISPSQMFDGLRGVAALVSYDPSKVTQEDSSTIGDLGMLGEYLEDLPYQSAVLGLSSEDWIAMGAHEQSQFIADLESKLNYYRKANADNDRWYSLAPGSAATEHVYPVLLDMMP